MNENKQKLEIVDEDDIVIGFKNRDAVHSEGLLHREIHIWFLTPKGEIIFQHRAKDKDTYPDKLDATVGGHVEPNMTYEETAIKECEEETGVSVKPSELVLLRKMKKVSVDKDTGRINNTIRCQYGFLYKGEIKDLKIENGKSEGFEAWGIDKLQNLSELDKDKFIPLILQPDMLEIINQAKTSLI